MCRILRPARACGTAKIVLNEICAAGTECDPDVRIRDFIEQLRIDSEGEPLLTESERMDLDEDRVHLYRSPDGGSWQVFALGEAEEGWPGSFGRANGVPPETPGEAAD